MGNRHIIWNHNNAQNCKILHKAQQWFEIPNLVLTKTPRSPSSPASYGVSHANDLDNDDIKIRNIIPHYWPFDEESTNHWWGPHYVSRTIESKQFNGMTVIYGTVMSSRQSSVKSTEEITINWSIKIAKNAMFSTKPTPYTSIFFNLTCRHG